MNADVAIRDAGQWRALLLAVLPVWKELMVSKNRQSSPSSRSSGVVRSDRVWVFKPDAAQLMWDIEDLLRVIMVTYHREAGQVIPMLDTPSMVVRLVDNAQWVSKRDTSPDWFDRLNELTRRGWLAVGNPPDLIRLGVCGAATEAGHCESELWYEQGDTVVQCKVCGAVADVRQRRDEALMRAADYRAPLTIIVQALKKSGIRVTEAQARSWTQRRSKAQEPRLKHVDINRQGVRLYTVGDVMRAATR